MQKAKGVTREPRDVANREQHLTNTNQKKGTVPDESKTQMSSTNCADCGKSSSSTTSLKRCAGCSSVSYCSKECQAAHWKSEHKRVCKKLATEGEKKKTQVLWEDQQRINRFSNLTQKKSELQDLLTATKHRLDDLSDACEEVEIALDDEACKIMVGEMFVDVSNDEATEFLEKQKEEVRREYEAFLEDLHGVEGEMKDLKTRLYAKFGSDINLESEETDDAESHLKK